MAVAITPFEALCSFQPAYSILSNLRATPELVSVIGDKVVGELERADSERGADGVHFEAALQALFRALMTADDGIIKAQLSLLIERIDSTSEMLRAPVDVLAA